MKHKDINDMILAGYSKKDIQQIITDNTFQTAAASLRFAEWRKISTQQLSSHILPRVHSFIKIFKMVTRKRKTRNMGRDSC